MDKKKKQRIRFLLKISCGILYVLGVSWIFVGFPLISVITGEFSKPREIYIDEHSLQTNFNSLDTKSLQMNMPALQHEYLFNYSKTKSSFCDLMRTIIKKSDYNEEKNYGNPNSKCLQFKTKQESKEVSIDVMKIEPNSAPTETNEAIAILIMPPPSRTSENADEFFLSFLLLIHRLSLSHNTRWLSKTLYFVCPSFINDKNNITAKEVSAAFLDAYYMNGFDYSDLDLPVSFIFPHIRNLLVFETSESREFSGISQTDDMKALKKNRGDNDKSSGTPSRIRILPQGYKGMLPNLDMVFSFVQILKSSNFLNGPYHRDQGILSIHPHSLMVENTIKTYFSESSTFLQGYIRDMLNLLAFIKTSIVGPFPPHANFLERGIDSLTIQVDFLPDDDKDHSSSSSSSPSSSIKNKNDTSYTVSPLIVDIEKMIRAISSLYEQLHHSHTQYLMSSPTKFTSHTEYIIPTLLLVLTAVIRALYLLIFKFGSKSYDTMEINDNQEEKKKNKEEKGENTNTNEDEVISTDNECKTIDKADQTKSNNIDDSNDMQQKIRMDRRQNIKMMKQTIYILCFIYAVLALAVLTLNMLGMAQTKKALLYYVMVYSYLLINVRKMYINCIIPTKNNELEEVLKQKKDTKDTSSTKSAEYHEVFLSQMKFSYCVQFSLCLLCIYTHIPLVLAHVSLCIPPLVCLWSPIISILFSFLDYDGDKRKSDTSEEEKEDRKIEYSTFCFRTRVVSIGMSFFWVLSFPPILFSLWLRLTDEGSLDAVRTDDSGRFVFNPYVIFVHTPLHLLLGLLCFMHFRIR